MESPITTPHHVIRETPRLNGDLADTALDLLDNWDRWERGIAPSSAAAAAYYAAGCLDGGRVTQAEVANLFDTSRVAIRNYYRGILEAHGVQT